MSYIYRINVLLSSIINQTNKNVALIPKQASVTPHYGSHDAFAVCINIFFISI